MGRGRTPLAATLALALCAGSCTTLKEMAMPSKASTFYVAPDGADANAGTRAMPFATLERARDAIRELKKQRGLPKGGARVYVRGGEYLLARTFELGPEDSRPD